MKLLSLLTMAGAVTVSAAAAVSDFNRHPRMTKIAGVEVIDTQIVRDAQATIKNLTNYLYTHQMRSWLFGAAMINANATLRRKVDLEVHAIATMLHDLGWDMTPGSRWVSPDKRFEVDGAIGARAWLREHPVGRHWSEERVRKVFQSIALHGSGSIVDYFELEEVVIVQSIGLDYNGPAMGVTPKTYDAIATMFPQTELLSGTNETFTWLARTKPETTYDTWLEPWGEAYVPGYSPVGHRAFDNIVNPPAK